MEDFDAAYRLALAHGFRLHPPGEHPFPSRYAVSIRLSGNSPEWAWPVWLLADIDEIIRRDAEIRRLAGERSIQHPLTNPPSQYKT